MAAVHILSFGEMAGFKIVPFIATHVKMKKKKKKKKKKTICMNTTDINLYDCDIKT